MFEELKHYDVLSFGYFILHIVWIKFSINS